MERINRQTWARISYTLITPDGVLVTYADKLNTTDPLVELTATAQTTVRNYGRKTKLAYSDTCTFTLAAGAWLMGHDIINPRRPELVRLQR